jgi:hypothetical protein
MRTLVMDEVPAPVTESEIQDFERSLGSSLPRSYREFIKTTNGGVPSAQNNSYLGDSRPWLTILHFFSFDKGYDEGTMPVQFEFYRERIDECFIPVAFDELGNVVCVGYKSPFRGVVAFWNHEFEGVVGGGVVKLEDDFATFLDALCSEEELEENL